MNFSLFSKHATSVELLLFARHDDPEPFQVILLDPIQHRTFHFWHVYVRGLRPGMHYANRLDGPYEDVQRTGDRFHRNKVVLDPYTRGITAVELLPVFAFDEQSTPFLNPAGGKPLKNVWGYDPVAHFAPHPAYCLAPENGSQMRDFREMVKALHQAGIEVILDVVFNHTGEGDHLGPTISFKGIDNSIYYVLGPANKERYVNYSGCGNTFKCNHPLVVKLITECLEFWAKEMHVDGFRLDEGSILTRGGDGRTLPYPPVLWYIELDEVLANAKLIAEAWDAAGLYQVGSFPGYRWAEWNGRYRDDVRRFVRGEPGMVGVVATRIAGSADLYQSTAHMPVNSINFITCHDGFTLNDLVSYNYKHSEANGEDNRDGTDANMSWNCGVEGETHDAAIGALRERQIKNCVAILMLSQSVPMILAGDEVRRTKRGNNNAYCQDNELSWFDWELVEKHMGLFRFFKLMIAFRKRHPNVRRERFLTDGPNAHGVREIDWHGRQLFSPDWQNPNGRILAFTIWGLSHDDDVHVMLNHAGFGRIGHVMAFVFRRRHLGVTYIGILCRAVSCTKGTIKSSMMTAE